MVSESSILRHFDAKFLHFHKLSKLIYAHMAGSRCGSPMSGGAVAGMGMVRHHGAGSGGCGVLNHFLRHIEHGAADDRLKEVKERHLKVNINKSFFKAFFLYLFSWRWKEQSVPLWNPVDLVISIFFLRVSTLHCINNVRLQMYCSCTHQYN